MSIKPFDFSFKKQRWTENFDYSRNVAKRDQFLEPLKVGFAQGRFNNCIEQLLFGHFERSDYALDLAHRLVDVVINEKEPFQVGLPHTRFIVKALCVWLSENRHDPSWWQKAYEATEEHLEDWMKDGAFPRNYFIKLDNGINTYLYCCLAAGKPEHGAKLIRRTDLILPKSYKSVKNFRDLAILATLHEAENFCSKEEVLLAGEKVFSKLIIDEFFNGINMFYSSLWLKYLYWDSGLIKDPRETILKAFDFAPELPKPILPK